MPIDQQGSDTRLGIKPPLGIELYVLAIVVLLPIDWFAPTGALLREFGAKPATMLLTLGGLVGTMLVHRERMRIGSSEFRVLLVFSAWLALGYLSALLNFVSNWSSWQMSRSPFSQLISQSLMVVASGLAIYGNVRLLRPYDPASLVAKYLPWAVAMHLSVFLLEASGLLQDGSGVLFLFRNNNEAMERPTGLFSEPSYFGTCAALLGTSLIYVQTTPARRVVNVFLAVSMFVSAVLIGAKTFVVVAGVQVLMLLSKRTKSLRHLFGGALVVAAVGVCALFFVQRYAALDVEENLSSAVRLGSAVLATNVCLHGYALPGIGFGQFHFFYRDEFAPAFLFLSSEALSQLNATAETRASTYNFLLRVFLETGVIGGIIMIYCLRRLWIAKMPEHLLFVSVLFAGALGFLLTQDTYFYPPLVFSAVLILSQAKLERSPVQGLIGEHPGGALMRERAV
jgi:hypothetical protein